MRDDWSKGMLTRRTILTGTLATATVGHCCAHAQTSPSRGCRLLKAAPGSRDIPKLLVSSKSTEIDDLFQSEAQQLNQLFGLAPRFGFYHDDVSPNALAVPGQGTGDNGTVLMGINLARRLAGADSLHFIAVAAHEWGHIFQFTKRLKCPWGVHLELSADYLAGWYLAKTERDSERIKNSIATLFSNIGDSEFANDDHHGTPRQRSNVLLSGASLYDYKRDLPATADEAFERWRLFGGC
jgi:hypothetical protein